MRYLLFAALLAAANAQALDMYRFGSRIVEVGDAVTKLAALAGEPVYKEPIESPQGGHEGERWQYSMDGTTVTFVIKDGRVASIEETRG